MKKYFQCGLAAIIGMAMILGLAYVLASSVAISPGEFVLQSIGTRPLVSCLAYYEESITADRFVILVDLSDNTNYPHYKTNSIIIKSLRVSGNLSAAMKWHYNVGVVTAVTTSTTTIEWIHGAPIYRSMFFDERWQLPEHGLSLEVASGELARVATLEVLSTGVITSSTEISTTVAVTGVVGVGDLILYTNEISDTATLDLVVSVEYDTE